MFKSIRILSFIAIHLNYEISQTNVKIAFLNGNLDKSIYMMQLNEFMAKSYEHMVCKLHKSIYGLKQTSYLLNIRCNKAVKTFDFD